LDQAGLAILIFDFCRRKFFPGPFWLKAGILRAFFDHSFHFVVFVDFSLLMSDHFHAGCLKSGGGQKWAYSKSTEQIRGYGCHP
jgi:hypothetical protein